MDPKLNRPRAVTIAGPGRVGRSLTSTLRSTGIETHLLGRDQMTMGQLPSACLHGSDEGDGEHLLLLAVPDSEIETACRMLCAVGKPAGPVGHLSGATPLSALAAAREAGVGVFSLHPLQTFPDHETSLDDIPCAVTADNAATFASAVQLAEALGMKPFRLAEKDRAIYHAAASIASNFLIALEEDAAELLARAGVPDGRRLLTPLIRQTLANWAENGAGALTGPILRGDTATVNRHLEALKSSAPEMLDLYGALAARTEYVAELSKRQRQREIGTV